MTTVDNQYTLHAGTNFWEQRVVFNPFEEATDIDPKSKKSGICTYWRIIALVLRLFGCVKIVDIPVRFANGEIKVLYLNQKSLDKWLKRHHGETAKTSDEYAKSIQGICQRYIAHRKGSQFLIEESDPFDNKAVVVRPSTPTTDVDPQKSARKAALKKLAAKLEKQFMSPSYQKVVKFTECVKTLASEAEQLCYEKSGQLNDFDLRYKRFSDKSLLSTPAALFARANRWVEGINESDPRYNGNKKEAEKLKNEAQFAAEQINKILFATSAPCILKYDYEQKTIEPKNLIREIKIDTLPVENGIFFFGAAATDIISVKAHGFVQPNFTSDKEVRSDMGLGLNFYVSEELALKPLLLERTQKVRTNTLKAKLTPKKIGCVENYLGLTALRDYFNIVAKAFLEMNGENVQRRANREVSVMQLGDALMTRFFTRQGYDAVYFKDIRCVTIYDHTIAKMVRPPKK